MYTTHITVLFVRKSFFY
uniref:Uncharacterized protein n=1 Tax=Arundo donax TaxID=35708 RepID=A0A0A8XV86_ARUDO